MKSSLCGSCSAKVERIFKQDENSLWFTMCGYYKIIIDYDDIEKIKNKPNDIKEKLNETKSKVKIRKTANKNRS